MDTETLWVVAKLKDGEYERESVAVVEEKAYWLEADAKKRAKHLGEHDNVVASVWPVRFWAPTPAPVETAPIPGHPPVRWGSTSGRGQELIAYGPSFESRPRLAQTVADMWLSWRQQQADVGNLNEAGEAGPGVPELELLYSEAPLPSKVRERLPLPGFLELVH